MAPADEAESRDMLYTAYCHPGPAAVRYPRGAGPGRIERPEMTILPIGVAHTVRQGQTNCCPCLWYHAESKSRGW